MRKYLILLMTFTIVGGLACAAYAEVQNVKVGGDVTAMAIMRELKIDNDESSNDKTEAFASIARLKVDADLTDNVGITVRLLNERYWGSETENAASNSNNTEIALDLAYVTLKEFLYSPLTVSVGRQNLRFGNAMIVGDPDTNNQASSASAFGTSSRDPDLSNRKAFDAFRATLNYDPLVVDLIYSEVTENTLTTQDDTNLYGVNANYKVSDKTLVEGYYFGKYTGRENTSETNTNVREPDRVDTVGAKIVTSPVEDLTCSLEAAYQFGKYIRHTGAQLAVSRRAWALEAGAQYLLKDMAYTPTVAVGYAYFTGQKGSDTKHCTAWDPMYEDQNYGDIANALFNQSNAHIFTMSGAMKPMDDVTLIASGYGFWWDKKYSEGIGTLTDARGGSSVTKHSKYAATELDLKAVYDYTEDVQFSLLTGILWPGGSFNGANDNTATEVIGSMKVTF